jgi:hypothetical protein
VVNDNVLKNRKDAVALRARLRETLDCVRRPRGGAMYAEAIKVPLAIAKTSVEKFQPAMLAQFDRVLDIDVIMANAVAQFRRPLTKEQIVEFIQIPPRQ